MKCYYHPNIDAVGQCTQCGKFACRQCLDDVGGAMLCLSCLAIARQQMAGEGAEYVAKAKTAVMLSYLLAAALLVLTAFMGLSAMIANVLSEGSVLNGLWATLFLLFSSYATWSGFWGWGPLYRAFKTILAQTGCIFLATPMTWFLFFLIGEPLKYRFFAGPASEAEGANAIHICSNGFSGRFIGSLSKKPILESSWELPLPL